MKQRIYVPKFLIDCYYHFKFIFYVFFILFGLKYIRYPLLWIVNGLSSSVRLDYTSNLETTINKT